MRQINDKKRDTPPPAVFRDCQSLILLNALLQGLNHADPVFDILLQVNKLISN
jgi:hypothetical protein